MHFGGIGANGPYGWLGNDNSTVLGSFTQAGAWTLGGTLSQTAVGSIAGVSGHKKLVLSRSGAVATNILSFSVPAAPHLALIKITFVNGRQVATDAGAAIVGTYYYSISRQASGVDVVLDVLAGLNSTATTSTAGGAVHAIGGATTIVRSGAEASTAAQGVVITYNPQTTGGSTGFFRAIVEIIGTDALSMTAL